MRHIEKSLIWPENWPASTQYRQKSQKICVWSMNKHQNVTQLGEKTHFEGLNVQNTPSWVNQPWLSEAKITVLAPDDQFRHFWTRLWTLIATKCTHIDEIAWNLTITKLVHAFWGVRHPLSTISHLVTMFESTIQTPYLGSKLRHIKNSKKFFLRLMIFQQN